MYSEKFIQELLEDLTEYKEGTKGVLLTLLINTINK